MTDTQQQHSKELETLKNDVCATADNATDYLTSLKKKLDTFDHQHKYGETAAKYMESALAGACDSVAELKQGTKDLTTNQVPKGAVDALMGVKSALDQIQQQARAFDHKFAPSSDESATASGIALKTLEETTNEARQRTMDMVERTQESFNAMQQKAMNVAGAAKTGAQVAAGETLRMAEKVDEKVGATGAVGSVIDSVAGTVKAVDSRMHISAMATKVDATVTGGLGARLVNTGVEMTKETLEYVSQTVQQAKAKASKSETVIMGEQKAEEAMEAVQHGMEKMGLTGAAQSTKEAAQSAVEKGSDMKDKAVEEGQLAKDAAMEKCEQAKGKAGDVKDAGMEKCEQAKDKAGDVKDAGMEKCEQAKDKAGDVKDQAKDTAGDMKAATMEKGGRAGEKVDETKDQAMGKAGDMKDAAMDKGSDLKEKAKDTAGVGHHSSGHHHKHQGGTTAEQAKDKAEKALGKAQNAM